MEKRCSLVGQERNWASCRAVLQRGLLLNRDAPALLQAWGLMEMQVGGWGVGGGVPWAALLAVLAAWLAAPYPTCCAACL
jgi:hypothetical protein